MNKRLISTVFVVLALALISVAPAPLRAADKRGLDPDDICALQGVADPRLSPDGRFVAFVVNTIDRRQNRQGPRMFQISARFQF